MVLLDQASIRSSLQNRWSQKAESHPFEGAAFRIFRNAMFFASNKRAKPLFLLVGGTGFEPVTPTMSR
jgi:hypothetical protein